MNETRRQAIKLCTPPFEYYCGYIKDSQGNTFSDFGDCETDALARIRGWGRLGKLENGDKVQDELGKMFAEALNEFWEIQKHILPPCVECGAETPEQAETKCNCSGDKDYCHGSDLWD